MLTPKQRRQLFDRISSGRMLGLANGLEGVNRFVGSRELEEVCELLAQRLTEMGADEVELLSYDYGPGQKHSYIERAELWLQEDDGEEVLLCSAAENPACVIGALRSTPTEGTLYEVVDVGVGAGSSDYRGHRMETKIALASGHNFTAAMLEALTNRKAPGLLCGPGAVGSDLNRVVPNRFGPPYLFGKKKAIWF
ncbi:MAG: hypothetical protein V1754_11770 [Pseudomonadota bacterium]